MGYLGKGPTRIPGKLYDSIGVAGTSGYILSSTATGIQWIEPASGGSSTFLNLTDTPGTFTASKFLAVNSIGDAIEFVDAPSGGGGGGSTGMDITLGTPTDGSVTDGNALLGFTTSTYVTDAIDDINEVLGKLAPAKPPNLSTETLSLATSYSATLTSDGSLQSNVTDDTTPQTSTVTEFWDGETGTLTAEVDGSVTGTKALTSLVDTGTFGDLIITADSGYPTSGNGANFWRALTAYIQRVSVLSVGSHTMQMKHSTTGDTNLLTFYVDDPESVTITPTSFDVTSATSSYVSGVPTINSGQTINVSFTINNAIKTFYNSTKVAEVSGSSILSATKTHTISGGQTYGNTISVTNTPSSGSLTVGSNKYSESNSLTIKGFNSKGTAGTSYNLTLTNVRVDTKSTNESSKRVLSGSGDHPSTGYGGLYDSTQSLKSGAYVNEMQYINGQFKYPPAVNYSSNQPTNGPDYSSGMGTGDRWWCYEHSSSFNAVSAFTLTISGTSGSVWSANANEETSGVKIFAKLEGATGWIDCNAFYVLGSTPISDGAKAMVSGESSATIKRVTFGTSRSGTLYIRIGFPPGSTKYFTGVSIGSLA